MHTATLCTYPPLASPLGNREASPQYQLRPPAQLPTYPLFLTPSAPPSSTKRTCFKTLSHSCIAFCNYALGKVTGGGKWTDFWKLETKGGLPSDGAFPHAATNCNFPDECVHLKDRNGSIFTRKGETFYYGTRISRLASLGRRYWEVSRGAAFENKHAASTLNTSENCDTLPE